MTDPISDFLTRIRNGQMAKHRTVVCPASKMKHRIAHILKEEGYIADVQQTSDGGRSTLTLTLRYDDGNAPIIEGLQRSSRPGLRRYSGVEDLPKVRGGLGMAIISTSKGVMSDHQARRDRIGGEVLCTVW
jgi:small subunit ribosomal protein S8